MIIFLVPANISVYTVCHSLSYIDCYYFVGSLRGMFQWNAHEGKVFSLHWATLDETIVLLSCGPDGKMVR